jgi:hypothetical protein
MSAVLSPPRVTLSWGNFSGKYLSQALSGGVYPLATISPSGVEQTDKRQARISGCPFLFVSRRFNHRPISRSDNDL